MTKDLDASREAVSRMLSDLETNAGPHRAEDLLPLVYEELRSLARARMASERHAETLQATGLVHEAYLRLIGNRDPGWNGKGHFFGAAARAMRRILVDQARRRNRKKRGGGHERERVDEAEIEAPDVIGRRDDLLVVEDAVQRLEETDARKGEIVNLRYFAGLTNEETANALGLSVGTIEREWRFIKSWLRTVLAEEDPGS